MDSRTYKPNVFPLIAWIVLVFIPIATFALASAGITRLAVLKIENPQEYKKWFINFLGVQINIGNNDEVPYVSDVQIDDVGTFPIKYWNGQTVNFYVTDEVLEAAEATDCDPWLLVAVAFSESPYYDNTSCSGVGACGVWQFMPNTWNSLWPAGNVPSRFDIPAAADAACRYMKSNGMAYSINKSRTSFIFDFAIQPPVWNMHLGQAGFVWDLVAEIRARGGYVDPINPPHTDPNPPFTLTTTWWKIPFILLFKELGMLPNFLAFDPDPNYPIDPQEGDEWVAWPYPPGSFEITNTLHGQDYGECAFDLARGIGTEVLSPINGVVTQRYVDGLNNPIIQIENSVYLVRLYHGDWTVNAGDVLTITQKVGYENTHGDTSTGPHTHFHIIKKGYGCTSPDLLINYPPSEEIEP